MPSLFAFRILLSDPWSAHPTRVFSVTHFNLGGVVPQFACLTYLQNNLDQKVLCHSWKSSQSKGTQRCHTRGFATLEGKFFILNVPFTADYHMLLHNQEMNYSEISNTQSRKLKNFEGSPPIICKVLSRESLVSSAGIIALLVCHTSSQNRRLCSVQCFLKKRMFLLPIKLEPFLKKGVILWVILTHTKDVYIILLCGYPLLTLGHQAKQEFILYAKYYLYRMLNDTVRTSNAFPCRKVLRCKGLIL